ncbi:two component system sensor histidine kinase, hybrid [Desulfosarcina variabilis str. Montpellier]|uniref:ATP-binding protein n=1 Tax=Desulfosarcina variabilis TaxID=2300 RepID=UPI003AFB14E8
MSLAHKIKSSDEAFYKYNLVKGAYDYIIPATEETPALFIHEWLNKDNGPLSETLHPEDRSRIRDYFDHLAGKQPEQVHRASLEYRLRLKEGGFRWFRDRHVLVFNGSDCPRALIGSVRDITMEKEAESTLQTYAHIISASSDYLALIDRQYTYQAISTAYAEQLRQPPGNIIGRSVAQIMGPEVFEQILKPLADRCLAGEKVSLQFWHNFEDDKRRLLDIVYTPHYEKGRTPKTVAAYVERTRDITDIAKLEEQLRQSCKLETIGMLTGSIAHDFNNILSAILGYSEISLQMAVDNSELQGYLKRILSASNRASNLVKQILNFSRKGEQDVRPVQIKHIVDEALALIRASLPVTITIERQLNSEAFVLCDATQIYQILVNLCSNAGYAMREKGGVLTVRLADITLDAPLIEHHSIAPGRYVQLCVSDTGVGMTAEVKKRIFDPFFTTKEKGKGTGIGLSLTHDIIINYRGALAVESEPGKGATFTVYLPVVEDPLFLENNAVESLPRGHAHILLVDDEDALVDLGKQMIESLGYRVTSRVNSLEALSLFKNQPDAFDLLITDLIMPHLTGDELIRKIHQVRPNLPVILVTGFTDRMTQERADSMGVAQLAIKPVIMKDMARYIHQALNA